MLIVSIFKTNRNIRICEYVSVTVNRIVIPIPYKEHVSKLNLQTDT